MRDSLNNHVGYSELNGRVVGYSELYVRDPSHLREGEGEDDLIVERTRWAEVRDAHPAFQLVEGRNVHTGENTIFARLQIHTVMPESYR